MPQDEVQQEILGPSFLLCINYDIRESRIPTHSPVRRLKATLGGATAARPVDSQAFRSICKPRPKKFELYRSAASCGKLQCSQRKVEGTKRTERAPVVSKSDWFASLGASEQRE